MDQHEPQVQTNSNNSDSEISAARRILNSAGNFLNDNKDKVITRGVALLAAGALTIGLVGCGANASAEGPAPTTTTSAEATPSAEPSKTPEATATPETKFTGTINYEKLTGEQWETLSPLDKYAACNEFFTSNIENEAVMTQDSTGPEVQQWFTNRLNVLQSLVLDKSNDLNFEASKNIVDCMAKIDNVSQEESVGHKDLLGDVTSLHQSNLEGDKFVYIDPAQITRYSDGNYDATSTTSLPYKSKSVEGYQNNGWGGEKGQLAITYFEWTYEEAAYRYVLTSPAYDETVPLYFGDKPPVVLDPARQNARADQNH